MSGSTARVRRSVRPAIGRSLSSNAARSARRCCRTDHARGYRLRRRPRCAPRAKLKSTAIASARRRRRHHYRRQAAPRAIRWVTTACATAWERRRRVPGRRQSRHVRTANSAMPMAPAGRPSLYALNGPARCSNQTAAASARMARSSDPTVRATAPTAISPTATSAVRIDQRRARQTDKLRQDVARPDRSRRRMAHVLRSVRRARWWKQTASAAQS